MSAFIRYSSPAFFSPLWRGGLADTSQPEAGRAQPQSQADPRAACRVGQAPLSAESPGLVVLCLPLWAHLLQPLSPALGSRETKHVVTSSWSPELLVEDSHWRLSQRMRSVLQTQGLWPGSIALEPPLALALSPVSGNAPASPASQLLVQGARMRVGYLSSVT